jgi:hypothetical protein
LPLGDLTHHCDIVETGCRPGRPRPPFLDNLSINSLRVKMPGRLRSDGGRRAVSPWPCAIWPASSYQQFMLETGRGNVARVFVRFLRSDASGRRGMACSNAALCSGTPWTSSERLKNLLRPERWSLRCSRLGASPSRRQGKCGIRQVRDLYGGVQLSLRNCNGKSVVRVGERVPMRWSIRL